MGNPVLCWQALQLKHIDALTTVEGKLFPF
jgi:hypothetical protein